VNVRFLCPNCECLHKSALPGPRDWKCDYCDHLLDLNEEFQENSPCVVCKNTELYRKKDFPHGFGLLILTIACAASFITYAYYEKWLTWAILIGTAVFDGLLFLWVGDAIVCYRCNAHYRGLKRSKTIAPFDLGIGERYRQERIRHEQLDRENRG
jgi:hypothetical protein